MKTLMLCFVLVCASANADTLVKLDGKGGAYCKDKWGYEYHNVSSEKCEELKMLPRNSEFDFDDDKPLIKGEVEKPCSISGGDGFGGLLNKVLGDDCE